MKKVLAFILIAAMAIMCAACGGSKSVTDAAIKLNINGSEVAALYTGPVDKNGLPSGEGKALIGEYTIEGTFSEGECVKGEAKDLPMFIKYDGKKREGVYTGAIEKYLPEGSGSFYDDSDGDGFFYEGEFHEGQIYGKGKISADKFTIHFPEFDRTGGFIGETVNGIPEGHGGFKSQNSEGTVYIYDGDFKNGVMNGTGKITYDNGYEYEGEFKDGLFDGQGKMTYNGELFFEGEWVDNNFNPTILQTIEDVGKDEDICPYTLKDEEKKFLEDNIDLLTTNSAENCKKVLNPDFKYDEYINDSTSQGYMLAKEENLIVQQIEPEIYGNRDYTYILLHNDDDSRRILVQAYFDCSNINENDRVTITYFPLTYSKYFSMDNEWVNALPGVLFAYEKK